MLKKSFKVNLAEYLLQILYAVNKNITLFQKLNEKFDTTTFIIAMKRHYFVLRKASRKNTGGILILGGLLILGDLVIIRFIQKTKKNNR